MPSVEFDADDAIQGLQDIQNKAIPNSIKDALDAAAEYVLRIAHDLVPVDTGELQQSLGILDEGDDYVVVGSDLEYASYVEFGTSKMEPQPYLTPALDALLAQLPDMYIAELESHMPT